MPREGEGLSRWEVFLADWGGPGVVERMERRLRDAVPGVHDLQFLREGSGLPKTEREEPAELRACPTDDNEDDDAEQDDDELEVVLGLGKW